MTQVANVEVSLSHPTRAEVDVTDARQTAHPQMAVAVHAGTNAPTDITIAGERVLDVARLQVVQEDAVVGANP